MRIDLPTFGCELIDRISGLSKAGAIFPSTRRIGALANSLENLAGLTSIEIMKDVLVVWLSLKSDLFSYLNLS